MTACGTASKPARVYDGDALDVIVEWGEVGLLTGPPTSVDYAVFDHATGVQIGSTTPAGVAMAARMEFVVNGALIVNTANIPRRLTLQVRGIFDGGHPRTVVSDVYVTRRLG